MSAPDFPSASHPTVRLIGTSPAIVALRNQIQHLASFDAVGSLHVPTVLLQGETGTGKGLVARIIHDSGPRAQGPFSEVNCAAIPDTMLEAELFGFEAGAFTDAKRAKAGLFEAASTGTLFLDEVDALPLALQGKLLTAIETKCVRRLGAVVARAVDVKLIAATNAVLPEAVAAGRFRADLYHRLAVVVLGLPPLRMRVADVLVLAQNFLQHYTAVHGVVPKRLSAEAEAWLQSHSWPGNVRELSHVLERVALLHMEEEVNASTLIQLSLPLAAVETTAAFSSLLLEPAPDESRPVEAEEIRRALAQTGGNVVRAARLLGVSRDTVRYRMQRYGLTRPRPEPSATTTPPHRSAPRRISEEELPPRQDSVERAFVEPADDLGRPLAPVQRDQGRSPLNVAERRHDASAPVDKPNAPPLGLAWEQKPVAVLALELTWPEVSGRASRGYDPWAEMARWEQMVVAKVEGLGGVLLQRTPALWLWVFGVPQTLEQSPQRAVYSALSIRQMVSHDATDASPCPEVRLAVHLGSARIDSQAADPAARLLPVGDTLVLPVRLLGQAEPGEIVVSPEVGRSVDGWVALETRTLQLHTGDSTRVGGYAVVGMRPGRAPVWPHTWHFRTGIVGRERELELLDTALKHATDGRGQVVNLMGVPGIGKSRLLYEFRQRLTEQSIHYAEGQCIAGGTMTPYLPILGLLQDHCCIPSDDRPAALTTKLRLALEHCQGDLGVELPLLLDLMGVPIEADHLTGIDAEARRRRMFDILWQLFLPSGRHQPHVLAVDNLHWIDPTSEAFLAGLIERVADQPLLVLTTARPGYRPSWGDKSYVTQHVLSPLDLEDSRRMVRSVLAHLSVVPSLEQQILTRAGGNPFFLEELARLLREQSDQPPALPAADTIQAVLAGRLDHLPEPEKRLVQVAAVIGSNVAVPLLQAIVELPEATLHRGLAYLQAAEFLVPRSFVPTPTYTFKHALTHEVVYQSLPTATRRQYHNQVAQALTEHFPTLGRTQPELLAHHYTAAGRTEQAIACWQQAGYLTLERAAYPEAMAHLSTGLALLQDLPDTPERHEWELALQRTLGPALMAARGMEGTAGSDPSR